MKSEFSLKPSLKCVLDCCIYDNVRHEEAEVQGYGEKCSTVVMDSFAAELNLVQIQPKRSSY